MKVTPCSEKTLSGEMQSRTVAPLCFQVFGTAEAIGGRALCQSVLCS